MFQKCLQLDHGIWKVHSEFDRTRTNPSLVTTETASFFFGGRFDSGTTFEYLPNDSNTQLNGKTDIPGGFWDGAAIAVKSEKEILLIGGFATEERILSFNVNDHTFLELPIQLNKARYGHKCAYIPNTDKIMITGGRGKDEKVINSCEILDTTDWSITRASPMNSRRCFHGMGVITINGKDRLAALGGHDREKKMLDNVEVYNTKTQKWETTDLKLNEPKEKFGFLTVKLGDVISLVSVKEQLDSKFFSKISNVINQ